MFDNINLENGGMWRFILDNYKNQKMSDESLDNYFYALEFVPDSYKTKNICDKAVDTYPFVIQFFLKAMRVKKHATKLLIVVFLYLILFLK